MDGGNKALRAPKVSVRIPAFNHEQFIERCLQSVYDDDFVDKELVIIDDGSTDSTPYLIERWIGSHDKKFPIRYISRDNRGLSSTLNELVELSRGDYLVSLASDDYLLNGGISARVRYLEEYVDKYAVI